MKGFAKAVAAVGVLFAVGTFFTLNLDVSGNSKEDTCPVIHVNYGKVTYTDPMPYRDEDGNLVNFAPREQSSQLVVHCFPGFSLNGYVNKITCGEDAKWSTDERPTCVPYWSKMQLFVFFAFTSITVMLVFCLWRSCNMWNRNHESLVRGSIWQHHELLRSADGELSEHEMGNHSAIILTIETLTLFIGFSRHFIAFLEDGVWYLNPSEQTMVNPGQTHVSNHVLLGFTICVVMFVMSGFIKLEVKKNPRGPLRKTHAFLGTYIIPPVAVCFLASAVWAELQLPGNVSQKIARNMLTIWVAIVLYYLVKNAWNKNIKAHLHYVVCFWGLVCSAGALRGMGLLWGYMLGCEYGYAANPTLGIVTGTLFSTLFPMLLFVHWNNTWKKPYARWCIFFASYYQLLIPLYFKFLFRPCYPRMNMAKVYPAYKFPMPREFYDTEESYMEAFMYVTGVM